MIAKYDSSRILVAFLVFRFGDILLTGTDREFPATSEAMITFLAIEIDRLTVKTPIIFAGANLGRADQQSRTITTRQSQYDDGMRKIDVAQFIRRNKIPDPAKLRTALRQALGSLIWHHQSLSDIGFDITKIAMDSPHARSDVSAAMETMMLYNRAVRVVQNYDRKIGYRVPMNPEAQLSQRAKRFQMMRLVVLADAGFFSLVGSRSIEGSVDVLAEVVSRDGVISCQCAMTDRRCAKIHRVCKSSLVDEGNATLTAADQAFRMEELLREIATDAHNVIHIAPPSGLPLPDPFGPSPTDAEVKWQRHHLNAKRHIHMASCSSCGTSI